MLLLVQSLPDSYFLYDPHDSQCSAGNKTPCIQPLHQSAQVSLREAVHILEGVNRVTDPDLVHVGRQGELNNHTMN